MEQKPGPSHVQMDGAEADLVTAALDRFQVVRNRYLRWLIDYTPIVLGLWLLIDWVRWQDRSMIATDLFRVSTILTVAVELIVLRVMFQRVPQDLGLIWARGAIRSANDSRQPSRAFKAFIGEFGQALNSRWAWLAGALLGVLALSGTYGMRVLILEHKWPDIDLVNYYFRQNFAIVGLPLGYLLGLLAWRVGMIAFFVNRLGQRFDLAIQPKHPDKCGGLRPLGDWCLMIALFLLIPAVYLSFWGIVITFFPSNFQLIVDLWGKWYQQLLVVLSATAVFLFFRPLYVIHLQMEKRRREIQAELDDLSRKIDEIMFELRNKAETLTPEQGKQRLEMMDFMQKVYEQSKTTPTWPFDANGLWRFVAAQAVPLLGLISTTKPLIPVVQAVLSVLPK